MELNILGSGTFVPENNRRCPGYLVKTREQCIALDFGRGAIDSLLALKLDPLQLDGIFISHLHADHAAELIPYFQLVFDTPNRETPFPKRIYGPRGIRQAINEMLRAFHLNGHKNLGRIEIHEILSGDEIKGADWRLRCNEVIHDPRITSLCFVIASEGKKFVYSGDSSACQELKSCCMDADAALLEATLPLERRPRGHLSGAEVGKIAEEAHVKKLIVTHIAGIYLKDVLADVRSCFSGEVLIAEDHLRIRI